MVLLVVTTSCEHETRFLSDQERLQKRLEDFATGKPNLAVSAAIIKNGEVHTAVVNGSHDTRAFGEAPLFAAGSTTKMFTAALIIQWADEHKIPLDSKVSDFLSLVGGFSPDITIRHLLTHTSGLSEYVTEGYLGFILENPNHRFSSTELLQYVPESPLKPDGVFRYANTNYLLLGMLLEKWSGQNLGTLLKDKVFDPISMDQTTFSPFGPIQGPFQHFWADIDGDGNPEDLTSLGFVPDALLSGAWSAGGIVSSPEDMVMFLRALFNDQLLNKTQLKAMQEFAEVIPGQYGYGMGLQKIMIDGQEWLGHDGSLLHYTMAYYHPGTDAYVVIMANLEDYNYDSLLIEIAGIFQ